ncbi:MAG: hypothetical protein IKC24_06410 [Oscillospiraceae bacterium]|nr:hypothetical protein [Oscillospiraceae bacterium]
MSKAYILYNPKAGSGSIQDDLDALEVIVDDDIVFADLTKSEMPQCVLTELEEDDYIILCGGDGTVNRFVNELDGVDIPNEIFCFPCGLENRFAEEYHAEYGGNPFSFTQRMKTLSKVNADGRTYRFIRSAGFAPERCRESDLRSFDSRIMSAMRTYLSRYKPVGATVCVDGVEHRLAQVWIATTMQEQCGAQLSLTVLHGGSKLKTMATVSSLLKGKISEPRRGVSVFCGRNITVTLDEPRPLQIDGETIPDVVSYTATR